EGYGVVQVNPAYTSQIGKEKYSRKMGCTVHMAASFVIGRRGMGYQN
ncbi:transposase, partial [Holdemania filiformis]